MSRLAAALFKSPPGPSPWYLRGQAAGVRGYRWQDAGEAADATAGVVMLVRGTTPVLLLDFYNYVAGIGEGRLLVWHQPRDYKRSSPPIVLRVFRCADLPPLGANVSTQCKAMRKKHASFVAGVPPVVECEIPTTIVDRQRTFECPEEIRHLDELLLLCRSSGIGKPFRGNLAMAVVRPADGTYQLFPQDWFNDGPWDYGYEWVTRVARNPKSGRIHGDGIRIGAFVLDKSLRKTR